jgi:hypothetical protein
MNIFLELPLALDAILLVMRVSEKSHASKRVPERLNNNAASQEDRSHAGYYPQDKPSHAL